MKMKRMNKATFAWLGGFLLLMASCNDDENGFPPAEAYRYTAVVSDRNTFQVNLPDLSGIASIGDSPYWFTATPAEDGDKSVTITVTKERGEECRKDSVLVDGVAGDRAFVVVEQAGVRQPDYDNNEVITDPEYLQFLKDWENMKKITYDGKPLSLPWSGTSGSGIADGNVVTVKKKDGWEMAFSAFHSCQTPYFGVYNKYLGILRIFYYNDAIVSTGSEWIFRTHLNSASPMAYHALYNSMLYGIPASHNGVENKAHYDTSYRLNGSRMLTQAVNPYGGAGKVPSVSRGWTAYDVDMSHYSPLMYDRSEVDNIIHSPMDMLGILNESNNLTTTTLFGSLMSHSKGNIDGTMSMTTTNANGLNAYGAWNNITSGFGKFVGGIIDGKFMDVLTGGGSALYNGYMVLTGRKVDHFESNGTFGGTLAMETSGRVDVQGFEISANGSLHSLSVSLGEEAAITGSHLGKGVWSLVDDPVIYVVNDYITGQARRFNMIANNEAGTYLATSNPRDMRLQLITCPDPSTLKVNISPVFKDVKNVKVNWTWGVYTGGYYPMGHSRTFRSAVLGYATPQFVLFSDHKEGDMYGSSSSGENKMTYKRTNASAGELQSLGDNKNYVWGNRLTDATVYGERFVASPCLLLPFTDDGNYKVYDPVLHDLVVGVVVSFDFRNDEGLWQRALLSKRFLPKVETVTLADLKRKMADPQIQKYMEENAVVDGVGYPTADQTMKPSMDILNQL